MFALRRSEVGRRLSGGVCTRRTLTRKRRLSGEAGPQDRGCAGWQGSGHAPRCDWLRALPLRLFTPWTVPSGVRKEGLPARPPHVAAGLVAPVKRTGKNALPVALILCIEL